MHIRLLIRDLALIIIGMLIGACVYHAIFLHQIQELTMRNLDLQDKLSHYQAENEDLIRYKHQSSVIKSISVHIYEQHKQNIPAADEALLKKKLLQDLGGMKGRSVFQIDEYTKLIEGLLTSKVYTNINDHDYTISVRTMLVAEGVLHVWVDARLQLPTAL
ncbi:hypothetical protein [Paenibacillus aquistagni]|uniref:hypothetical protein n=1 Tax=Paenibacillus aquistagni TaxID=1852522 RepID=UPI000B508068|nr:hypothetical protein [Paenibacillus aquistagni]